MKNNILMVVLIVIVVILSGSCVLLGITSAVSLAVGPLTSRMAEISEVQKEIQRKFNEHNGGDVTTQLMLINQKLGFLEARLNNNGGIFIQQAPRSPQAGGGCGGGTPQDSNKLYTIPIGESQILGKKDAPVTIVAFFDFQCPFCSRFYPPIKDVLKAYPDKVKFVIKNYPLPFHSNALPAAKLALAANLQGKYYEMVDVLLQNGAVSTEDKIKEYAKTLNINYSKLMDDFTKKDAQWQKRVDEDKTLAGQVGVRGTPTFFINGRLTSARDFNSYKIEIDKILAGKK